MLDWVELEAFIVAAKAATYIGNGTPSPPCRPASHDLAYLAGDYSYLDSYFGGSDFIGEEIVYYQSEPVWGMNYFGVLLRPDIITAQEVGQMLKNSLSLMYQQGRFLGGWQHIQDDLIYHDTSQGELTCFSGREWIEKDGQILYELTYHGGLIR